MRSLMLLTTAACFVSVPVFAQATSPVTKINAEAATANITVQPLRGNISVLMGSGGNITVLAGPDGKFLVDAGIAVSKEKLAAALAGIGPMGLKYLVNTHWHWDHTDGNAWMHDGGATIIAHENTRKYLSRTTRVDDWNYTFPPVPRGALPTVIVNTSKTMTFDGETIAITSYVPSHTDGDLGVRFENADVVVTGDTFWNGMYPFIDNMDGGRIDGMIRAVDATLKHVGDKTLIVPGHGPVGDRSDLVAFRDMLITIRGNVATLKKQGKSRDQVIAAKPSAAFDGKWGSFVIDPDFFVRLVYAGL
jgi:glyoxylase-like metal-dependent hydrolase (beta-lactamase superfamily II)